LKYDNASEKRNSWEIDLELEFAGCLQMVVVVASHLSEWAEPENQLTAVDWLLGGHVE